MPDVSEKIIENLRYLRRYARALLGSQQTGDTYVRICLEDLLVEPDRISAEGDVRLQLFRLFHDVWSRTGVHDHDGERLTRRATSRSKRACRPCRRPNARSFC